MGKGDQKTGKGKRFRHSFGKTRLKPTAIRKKRQAHAASKSEK